MLTLALTHQFYISLAVVGFCLVCILLVLTILIQRPQGGGLSGAFGSGAGSGQTAFGAKTGDALTIFTIGVFVVYMLSAIGLNYALNTKTVVEPPEAKAPLGAPPAPTSGTSAPVTITPGPVTVTPAPAGTTPGAPSTTPPSTPTPVSPSGTTSAPAPTTPTPTPTPASPAPASPSTTPATPPATPAPSTPAPASPEPTKP